MQTVNGSTIITYNELIGYAGDEGKAAGVERLFYCPIHGSDHQRSLHISEAGDKTGIGYCHACHARVICEDYPNKPARSYAPSGHHKSQAQHIATLLAPKIKPLSPPPPEADSHLITLRALWPRMQAHIIDEKAQSYLKERALDYDMLQLAGAPIGYIPASTRLEKSLAKWQDRMMFPLWRPDCAGGFIGRSLAGWQPGIDENQHKELLKDSPVKRWEKTNVAGWYAVPDMAAAIVIVEGVFDALTLFVAGLARQDVVALGGTACDVSWLPPQVRDVTIALDGDAAGQQRANKIALDLLARQIKVKLAKVPDDGLGKDASERYRRAGNAGIAYI